MQFDVHIAFNLHEFSPTRAIRQNNANSCTAHNMAVQITVSLNKRLLRLSKGAAGHSLSRKRPTGRETDKPPSWMQHQLY